MTPVTWPDEDRDADYATDDTYDHVEFDGDWLQVDDRYGIDDRFFGAED